MSNAPILASSLDYTDKDFTSIRLRLFALIQSVFPTWSDQNVTNFGNLLLELFAFTGDILTFYQDNQGRESRMVTATQRKNVIALAKMLGYTPMGATAAQATEVITLKAPPIGSVTIPKGSTILTADITNPVSFQLLADAVIAPGASPPTTSVTVENSANAVDTFTSSGLPDQSFVLTKSPYLDNSSTIVAGNGTYAQVDNFLDSISTDRHYTVVVDQNDRATITFGDGINGAIPSATITNHYKTGGGLAGLVEPGAISNLQGSFTDNLGNPIVISVTNPQKSSGGDDRQTIQQIQTLAPASVRAETRCVSREDFEINAVKVPGVARALMTTSNEDPAVPENSGILYVVPNGGGTPTDLLLSQVATEVTVTFPSTLTFRVAVDGAVYFVINVFLRVFKQPKFTGPQVGANLRATLASYFAISLPDGTKNPKIDFGANYLDANGNPSPIFPLGPLFDACGETVGVNRIGGSPTDFLLNNLHQDLALLARQFPILGTVTITDADTGLAI